MSKSVKLSFPVVSFRHLQTPFHKAGLRDYYAVVDARALPDLTDWREINVRDPKLTGSVPKAIRASFHDNPEMFLFMNRGIVLSVESAAFDNEESELTLTLSNPKLHGLLDGGHSYNIIMEEVPNLEERQFVKLELLEGFTAEDIAQVVDARNTSNQVKDESLMNLGGQFELLKEALEDAPYFDQIAFKEYEMGQDGEPKPIDVREVIAILTAFDRDNFTDKIHPIGSYRSKAACLKHFREHSDSYEKIYPLAQDVLALYDHVQEKLPYLYNTVRGETGNVTGGKFGKLTGVSYYKGLEVAPLYYLGKKAKYGVPDGFVYPVLAAFRAILHEKHGRYIWGKGLNPEELLQGELGLKLADTIGNFALDAKNPSKTGKSVLVWQSCYQSAQVTYLQTETP